MPKDSSLPLEMAVERSPIGGLSLPLYEMLLGGAALAAEGAATWSRSPVGGLSLPEFLRIAGLEG